MRAPSGLNAAATTRSLCPESVASAAPLVASHTRAVLSSDAVTTLLPSGLKEAAVTASSWRKGRSDGSAGRRVPDLRGVVLRSGNDARAVAVECGRGDRIRMR
jgi:hypothetical protein